MIHYLLDRMWDLVKDPRTPLNVIPRLLKERELRAIMNRYPLQKGDAIFISLTFDVEREYGTFRIRGESRGVGQFFHIMQDWISDITIFIEGSLIRSGSRSLNALHRKGVEIGLHGYDHELWGPPQWYLPEKPLTPEEKDTLLDMSIEAFKDSGLPSPTVFRAPNLVADNTTMGLLMAKGFSIDSSLPAHRGIPPIPQRLNSEGSLLRIPVSADPSPSISRKLFFPHLRFCVSNLKTLKEMEDHDFLKHVSRISALQKAAGFPPHLVILSHSWEFSLPRSNKPEYAHCTPDNLRFLSLLTDLLLKSYDVKLLSLGDLAEHLSKP